MANFKDIVQNYTFNMKSKAPLLNVTPHDTDRLLFLKAVFEKDQALLEHLFSKPNYKTCEEFSATDLPNSFKKLWQKTYLNNGVSIQQDSLLTFLNYPQLLEKYMRLKQVQNQAEMNSNFHRFNPYKASFLMDHLDCFKVLEQFTPLKQSEFFMLVDPLINDKEAYPQKILDYYIPTISSKFSHKFFEYFVDNQHLSVIAPYIKNTKVSPDTLNKSRCKILDKIIKEGSFQNLMFFTKTFHPEPILVQGKPLSVYIFENTEPVNTHSLWGKIMGFDDAKQEFIDYANLHQLDFILSPAKIVALEKHSVNWCSPDKQEKIMNNLMQETKKSAKLKNNDFEMFAQLVSFLGKKYSQLLITKTTEKKSIIEMLKTKNDKCLHLALNTEKEMIQHQVQHKLSGHLSPKKNIL